MKRRMVHKKGMGWTLTKKICMMNRKEKNEGITVKAKNDDEKKG